MYIQIHIHMHLHLCISIYINMCVNFPTLALKIILKTMKNNGHVLRFLLVIE